VKHEGGLDQPLVGDAALGDCPETRALFGPNFDLVAEFARMLQDEGEVRGLIGPSEAERIWDRHILNSAALLGFLPKHGAVADLGSGAGLPGIVLAIARPQLDFTLIEPMDRRVLWLREVCSGLHLTNVEVLHCRGEEVQGRGFAAVTSRAVAATGKLLNIAMPLLAPGGSLLALKGRGVSEELARAEKALRRYRVSEPEIVVVRPIPQATETTVLRIRKA